MGARPAASPRPRGQNAVVKALGPATIPFVTSPQSSIAQLVLNDNLFGARRTPFRVKPYQLAECLNVAPRITLAWYKRFTNTSDLHQKSMSLLAKARSDLARQSAAVPS